MRLIKMLGLAAVAVAAVMAFIGAGTASAGIHEAIGSCFANEPLLCKNLIPVPAKGGVILLAEAKNAELTNNGAFSTPEVCGSSKTAVLSKELMNNPVKGNVTELTFTECTGPCKKAEAKNLPYEGEVSMSTVGGTEWKLFTKKGGALLSECTFGVSCEFGAPAAGVTLIGTNTAAGGLVKANGVELVLKSGSEFLCGSTGKWTASYTAKAVDLEDEKGAIIQKHEKPWWFTLLGEVDKTH